MKLNRTIFWITFWICGISIFLFTAFRTFWLKYDINEIFSNISISLFGSSFLVFVPTIISFNRCRTEAKHKIISELAKVENLINDVQFQTTFLKGVDGEYNVDFSFEKTKYDITMDFQLYNAKKDIYTINSNRVETIYNTINKLDNYDYSFFNDYLNDYVSLFHNERHIKELSDCYYNILEAFMLRNFEIPYGYGSRQYDCGNATIGQFFDIWFKDYLLKLEPIFEKLTSLRTIFLILKLEFYKKDYKDTLNSKEINKKEELKKFIIDFYTKYNIKCSKKIKRLLKKDVKQNDKTNTVEEAVK